METLRESGITFFVNIIELCAVMESVMSCSIGYIVLGKYVFVRGKKI